MGLFDRVERTLDFAVKGVFAHVFKGEADPADIGVELQKEMDASAKGFGRDRKLVSNEFRVTLSRQDYDRLAPYARALNEQYVPGLRDYAATRQYALSGPVTVSYLLDETLPTGRFLITSTVRAGVAGETTAQPDSSSGLRPLMLEVNGAHHLLTPPGFTIGRGSVADVRINDTGISRLHARIDVDDIGESQPRITITDLNSLNGVIVDGQKVQSAPLAEASRIQLGSTRMLVVPAVGG